MRSTQILGAYRTFYYNVGGNGENWSASITRLHALTKSGVGLRTRPVLSLWKKVIGVDEDYIPAGCPTDLDFAMGDLPAGTQIEIVVSAVNSGGESQKSEKVTITVAA